MSKKNKKLSKKEEYNLILKKQLNKENTVDSDKKENIRQRFCIRINFIFN